MKQNLVPSVGFAGRMLPYMSAQRRHEIMDIAMEMLGGVDRIVHEANRDSESFWKFMSLWGKGLPRVAHQELNVGQGVEDLIEKLDAADREREMVTINGAAKVLDTA